MASHCTCWSATGLQQAGAVRIESSVFRSSGGAEVTRGNSAAYTAFRAEQVEPFRDHAGGERERVEDLLDLARQRARVAARQ